MIFHQPLNSLTNYNYNAYFYTDQIWKFHFHRNLELIYVVSGKVKCSVNNKDYILSKGEFGLCLPYDIHSYHPEENTLYWVLVFSEDFVRYFSKEIMNKQADGFSFRCNKYTEDFLKVRLINNGEPSIYSLKSCLYALCEEFLANVTLVGKSKKEAQIMPLIADFVLKHHSQHITLTDLADLVGYDYNYMSRFFKKIFNMTFTDFVNIYRIETAIKLLEDTDKSIAEIALESGFQSIRNFNMAFKNNTGMNPSEYRNASRI